MIRGFLLLVLLAGCGDLESNRICLNGCAKQAPVCATFIACFETSGGQPGALDTTYGPQGSCWTNPSFADSCASACTLSLAAQRDAGCTLP